MLFEVTDIEKARGFVSSAKVSEAQRKSGAVGNLLRFLTPAHEHLLFLLPGPARVPRDNRAPVENYTARFAASHTFLLVGDGRPGRYHRAMPRLHSTLLWAADGLRLMRVSCDGRDGPPREECIEGDRVRFVFRDRWTKAVVSPAKALFLRAGLRDSPSPWKGRREPVHPREPGAPPRRRERHRARPHRFRVRAGPGHAPKADYRRAHGPPTPRRGTVPFANPARAKECSGCLECHRRLYTFRAQRIRQDREVPLGARLRSDRSWGGCS